jgi:aspartate carbamoyltransferase regulatory subunit
MAIYNILLLKELYEVIVCSNPACISTLSGLIFKAESLELQRAGRGWVSHPALPKLTGM